MQNLEMVRLEIEGLKGAYLSREQLLQGQLGQLKMLLEEELNNLTEEQYAEYSKEYTQDSVPYETYIERVKSVIGLTEIAKANLACYRINLDDLEDHNNINFAKSNLYKIQGSLDYIDDIYDAYGAYFEDLL